MFSCSFSSCLHFGNVKTKLLLTATKYLFVAYLASSPKKSAKPRATGLIQSMSVTFSIYKWSMQRPIRVVKLTADAGNKLKPC